MGYLPYAGKNSIVESLLGVQFKHPIVPQVAETYSELEAEFKGEFPTVEQMQQVQLVLGPQANTQPFANLGVSGPAAVPTIAGINLSISNAKKKQVRVLRAMGSNISAHFMEYDNWADTRGQALRYIDRIFQILKVPAAANPITGVQLTFIDRFTYDGQKEDASPASLIRPNTTIFPQHIMKARNLWQSTSIWSEQTPDGDRNDNQLIVQSVLEANAAVVVTHNQGCMINAPLTSYEEGAEPLARVFDTLHDANASLLKNLLNDDMLKQIGLN